jgi:hypothetical protein
MARPTKFTPLKAGKIIQSLKAGATRAAACGVVRIEESTLSRWIARYASFAQHILAAEREAEARYIGVIAKAAFGHEVIKTTRVLKADGSVEEKTETYHEYDWQAARFWLSRRRREDWGDRVEIELKKDIEALVTELTSHETAADGLPTVH